MTTSGFSSNARDALARLARSGDRAPPLVFAGREDEIELIDAAVQSTREGEVGHTVVIQGPPGAGKTALLQEYGARLLAGSGEGGLPVVPVSLRPADLASSPAAILTEVDRQFSEFMATGKWGESLNRMFEGMSFVGKTLFAVCTKRDIKDFTPSARAPDSLPVALEEYMRFRFDRRDSTVVLMVDEAQNLADESHTRANLDALHGGVQGRMRTLLVCFGLQNTTTRLGELGLSRLASDHARSIALLGDEDSKQAVMGTLEIAFAQVAFNGGRFDDHQRAAWLGAAADAILAESGNFPHHLANGCRSLARIVLHEGIGPEPPVQKLGDECRKRKREYYEARLQPWNEHTIALSHAFSEEQSSWTLVEDVVETLMAADDYGRPVAQDSAVAIVQALRSSGFLEGDMALCRPALPSLSSHFEEKRRAAIRGTKAMQAIQTVLDERGKRQTALPTNLEP